MLQALRPPAAGRGDGLAGRGGRFETPTRVAEADELRCTANYEPVPAPFAVRRSCLEHLSTGYEELIATVDAPLEDEEDPPAPTALGARPAWCARLQSPETVRMSP